MVTLFYTKIHNEFFIFLGVALHYTIYHLDKNDLKAELAVEFFINGHLNALLYMYKYKDRLSIEDYLEIVKPVINNIFVLKNRQ